MLLPAVRVADAALLVRGPGGATASHSHHWWHLVVGLEAPLRVTGADHAWRTIPAVLTAPEEVHAIEASGEVAIVFVEPESTLGSRLRALGNASKLRALDEREARAVREELARDGSPQSVIAVLLDAAGAPRLPAARKHPAVARVIAWLASAPSDADVSLDALAARAGLSPSRFQHAFGEHVGLPLRPYVRWLRLRRAASELARGANATEAASAAGFSDAAHMTRTFREMLGVTPSELTRRSRSVQAE